MTRANATLMLAIRFTLRCAKLRLVQLGLVVVEDRGHMDWFDWGRDDKCPF